MGHHETYIKGETHDRNTDKIVQFSAIPLYCTHANADMKRTANRNFERDILKISLGNTSADRISNGSSQYGSGQTGSTHMEAQ